MDGQNQHQPLRRLLALIVILVILVSQVFLYQSPVQDQLEETALIWVDIIGVVALTLIFFVKVPSLSVFDRLKISISGKSILLGLSLGLSIVTLITEVKFGTSPRSVYIPMIGLWFGSSICYVAAFFDIENPLARVQGIIKRHRSEVIAVGLISILAILLRFYQLGEIPFVINGDEGSIGLVAQTTASGQMANPFALWDNFGAFYLQMIAISLKIFGANVFALRLVPAIGGVLAVPALYLLAREIAGPRVALIAAFLLAISHAHIHFSRTVAVAYIQGTWLVPLELFLLLRGLKKQNSWMVAASGVLLATHYVVYITSQIITGLILVYMLILLIAYHSWIKTRYRQVIIFWAGFFIVLLPELAYIYQHPNEFFSRLNSDGTIQTGWLAQMVQISGKSTIQILGERIMHAFLTLIWYPAQDFYGTSASMLTFITAIFFLCGLGVVSWKFRDRGFLLLNGYFWAVTISVGIFALPPSADSYRMTAALPAAFIIAAVGFDQILTVMGLDRVNMRWAYSASVAGILLAILATNIWIYFFDFAGRCKYGEDTQTRFSTHLGYYLSEVGRESSVYLLSDEFIFYGVNPSVDFLSSNFKVINVAGSIDAIPILPSTIIIAIPNRIEELRVWAQSHPGGAFSYRYDCQKPILSDYAIP